MDPVLLTVIIASVIGIAFVAVVVKAIIDKKKGKHSCSCGGNCGACPAGCCGTSKDTKKN